MEYVEGKDLCDLISDKRAINEDFAKHIFRQTLSAIEYCHMNGIVHGGILD
jgi:serine/threonine protein kinase